MNNELYHYGVLGMKWGVRRYQNKDGTLMAAGKRRQAKQDKKKEKARIKEEKARIKEEKAYTKARRKEVALFEIDLWDDFDKTEEGKRLKKEYQDQLDKLYSSDLEGYHWDDWSASDKAAFNKAAQGYLGGAGKYIAKQLIDIYGEEDARKYGDYGRNAEAEDFVQAMADEYVYVHGE